MADLAKIIGYLLTIENAEGKIMSALSDLQAEDASLSATIAEVISDWATALANASANGDSAAIEAVVSDMQTDAANLLASVPDVSGNTVTVTNPGNLTSSIAGGAVSDQMTAVDSDSAETLTFTATGLPAGLAISPSGLISGTPSTEGVSPVVVTATDDTGATGSASFSWTVTA
jgi:Putative Ig domain